MYSSRSDSESTGKGNATNELQFTVDEIANAPVFLEKSQTTKIKARKDEAIRNVTRKYEAMEGDSNPTIKKIGGALQIGIEDGSTQHRVIDASTRREETESISKPQSSSVKTVESLLPTRKKQQKSTKQMKQKDSQPKSFYG
ncbi:unnamed protein product [Psylliodes chrysocephalus]|uniref:Uncharacterized protein n=1 Tax=Psylliodes chrysocephalus TaxID=3402493 RepID=A0A9P0D1A0_9CUCU|nr:unnamed protein product [Psylliodes chrysocephala]